MAYVRGRRWQPITTATLAGEAGSKKVVQVNGRHIQINLGAGAQLDLELGMILHANTDPSYLRPWDIEGATASPKEQSIRSMQAAKM